MSSIEAFGLMEKFTRQVTDAEIRDRLIEALERRKPFRNFKDELGKWENVRQEWFTYEEAKYREWVTSYLEAIEE